MRGRRRLFQRSTVFHDTSLDSVVALLKRDCITLVQRLRPQLRVQRAGVEQIDDVGRIGHVVPCPARERRSAKQNCQCLPRDGTAASRPDERPSRTTVPFSGTASRYSRVLQFFLRPKQSLASRRDPYKVKRLKNHETL